jgi:hypothetical protein
MTNPLKDIAPGKWRRAAYTVLAGVGASLAGLMAGYGAVGADVPKWLIFTAAFYGTVTGPAWAVPASNVSRREL